MLELSREQPPDWMQFARTAHVPWGDIDAMIERTHASISAHCTLLVAILRAGSPIAALLARKTGLPLDYLLCNRINPQPSFIDGSGRAPRGHDILLVDDVCGSGWTFERARAYCESFGNRVKTFSIYRCEGPDMYLPDYSMAMDAGTYLRWPWEYQREPEMPTPLAAQFG
ncbi:phosphoribosyltransferase [Herbaspirillum sp. RV1423]|uniref:phosphoribosyltransferase family protein n=1 Tax=Herbaspirillum sp. RV1423 TaxID=1443993 RepID=UPI000558E433|nr:phosphoribosyltransferase [Herbaspirillum sp. RV1423]